MRYAVQKDKTPLHIHPATTPVSLSTTCLQGKIPCRQAEHSRNWSDTRDCRATASLPIIGVIFAVSDCSQGEKVEQNADENGIRGANFLMRTSFVHDPLRTVYHTCKSMQPFRRQKSFLKSKSAGDAMKS